MSNTINLRDNAKGDLIDLTRRVLETSPLLNQMSIISQISTPTGNGFTGGYIFKKTKRGQTKYTPATIAEMTSGFAGASPQKVGKVLIEKVYREDNIIGSKVDYAKLREGKGGDLLALEIGDFLLTGEELDLSDLLKDATIKANAAKIYTAINTVGAPTGNQPTQVSNSYVNATKALKLGKRTVTAIDMTGDNATQLVRDCIAELQKIGSPKSVEAVYPYSINGIPLPSIKVLTSYDKIHKFKDSFTTAFIDLSNPMTLRNFNGIVGRIDTVGVYLTNQLDPKDFAKIMSNRVLTRDLDPVTQYIGVVSNGDGRAVVLTNGKTKNVKPSEIIMALEQGRAMGVKYFEELITIKDVA